MADTNLTDKQVEDISFAVLRVHNSDLLWRALTYSSGPYDVTVPTLALRDLASAFYVAGMTAGMAAEREFTNRVMAQRDSLADALDSKAITQEGS
jgi:hypothetical protein